MATLEVRRPHGRDSDAARQLIEDVAKRAAADIGLRWRWDGDVMRFGLDSGPGKGTRGSARVTGDEVVFEVDLPFLMRPAKGRVRLALEKLVDGTLDGRVKPP